MIRKETDVVVCRAVSVVVCEPQAVGALVLASSSEKLREDSGSRVREAGGADPDGEGKIRGDIERGLVRTAGIGTGAVEVERGGSAVIGSGLGRVAGIALEGHRVRGGDAAVVAVVLELVMSNEGGLRRDETGEESCGRGHQYGFGFSFHVGLLLLGR